MSLSETILPYHNPVTPTTSSSSTIMSSTMDETPNGVTPCFFKSNLISWRVLGGIFATVLVVGWVFIIVILIQEEKWQLVLVAWLLLYAAAHFCYWYFKRHHLLSLHSQICGRARANVGSVGPMEKALDAPPSYEDIIKSEPPPPTYYSVVDETPKSSSSKSSRFTLFSFSSLPKVFGRSSSASTNETASTSGGSSQSSPSSIKRFGQEKPCSCSTIAYGHDISSQVPRRKSFDQGPPSYYDTFGGLAEAQINSPSMSQSLAAGASGGGYKASRKVHPILSPIYNHMQSSYNVESPCTSQGHFNTKKSSSASSSSCESSPCTRHGHSVIKKSSSSSISSTASAPCTPQGHFHTKKISSDSTLSSQSSPCSLHSNLTNKKSSSSSVSGTESYSSLRNS
ncbi:hypothetical protein Anas_11711 [Armadillidium nasatum]|uniref:Uncharacterized protein n=1 Tax=Armadillidium nasatum TaxID=96803 RepID=A0A5N5SR90_9CRUS|nr:hypothetical protein Anas_11711 [Armadillidium nasatum]